MDVLAKGGNAVDAAIAVGFALAVSYPAAGNIGGGGFMLVRMANGDKTFIDFRETAPSASSETMYLDSKGGVIEDRSSIGHKSVGVPGTVAGLFRAYRLYATFDWVELIEPAALLADEGFPVSRELAVSLRRIRQYIDEYPALGKFQRRDGRPLLRENILYQPDLAATLRRIAREGPEDFYKGKTAELIVGEMERGGGLLTKADLENYREVLRPPVTGSYRGLEVISAPPSSSGGTMLIEILNILENFELEKQDFHSEESVHWIIEAEKRAFADRAKYMGDPDFVDMPVSMLVSKKYAGKLASSIVEKATPPEKLDNPVPTVGEESEETTHYSIVDQYGNAVSVTTTLNSAYGSKVVVRGAGFLLNNEMDDFSIKPGYPNLYGLTGGEANAIAPGKRMLSSMAPTIVLKEGDLFLILGTPGGSTIITTIAQIIVNIVDFCMSPLEAVSAGRFHNQYLPDIVYHEKGIFPRGLMERLEKRGYRLKTKESIGDAQVIMSRKEGLYGVSDPRGGGKSLGMDKSGN